MTDANIKVREDYRAAGLTGRIKSVLATIAPENQTLTVAQLPPLGWRTLQVDRLSGLLRLV